MGARSSRAYELELPLLGVKERNDGPIFNRVVETSLEQATWWDILRPHANHIGSVVMVFILSSVAMVYEDPGARMWILVGLLSYVASNSWGSVSHLYDLLIGQCRIEVVVSSTRNPNLIHALTHLIIDSDPNTAISRDAEALIETDYVNNQKLVYLSFWGRRARRETLVFTDVSATRRRLYVDYVPGTEVICGRDAMPVYQYKLLLSMWSTDKTLREDWDALSNFCSKALETFMEPQSGAVDIYFPYESSTQWAPEWKRERSIKVTPQQALSTLPPSSTPQGLRFHLKRTAFNEILNDAQLWSQDKLRLYIVHGKPGVGKSQFVTRLAHATKLPIYRARLTSLSVRDDTLQQLFSACVMIHDTVLVHFDEFQGVLESWKNSGLGANEANAEAPRQKAGSQLGITPEGFNEFLQGPSSMQKGIVILTGSSELGQAVQDFPALFRRAACVCEVGPLDKSEVSEYFQAFLSAFISMPDEDWKLWGGNFANLDTDSRAWSIDSLQQYLMKHISRASERDIVKRDSHGRRLTSDTGVCDEHTNILMSEIVNRKSAVDFLHQYCIKY